jgi:hypothetical protein
MGGMGMGGMGMGGMGMGGMMGDQMDPQGGMIPHFMMNSMGGMFPQFAQVLISRAMLQNGAPQSSAAPQSNYTAAPHPIYNGAPQPSYRARPTVAQPHSLADTQNSEAFSDYQTARNEELQAQNWSTKAHHESNLMNSRADASRAQYAANNAGFAAQNAEMFALPGGDGKASHYAQLARAAAIQARQYASQASIYANRMP